MWGMKNPVTIKKTLETFSSPMLQSILKDNRHFYEKPLKPYLGLNIKPGQRAEIISQHYKMLEQTFGENLEKFYTEQGYEILNFLDREENSYRVVLRYQTSQSREGDLMLALLDSQHQLVYSIAFSIGGETNKTLYIGALQGPTNHVDNRSEVIKTLTRSLHGLRTKSLMVEVALMVARELGCQSVQAISNKGHIYQALRYMGSKRNKVGFDHDALWDEFGGELINKFAYSLEIVPERKDPSTLKKNKRRLYEKRYQWLAESEQSIINALNVIRWN
ncbi:hypothetical protein CS022_01045 [Veronia nyctiphanis]|uniref:DUF535 domain-containing protein n=1 Tax=Veronia nyctiphanis TaxID=1278244 RepID=A0A4Q0YVE0_9GAMM|nr:hypothetical protein CS022_01045 [Veronia nyctiphanis]